MNAREQGAQDVAALPHPDAACLIEKGSAVSDQLPCRLDPRGWDTDQSDVTDLRFAVYECRHMCPMLAACRAYVREHPDEIRSMVWGGTAYDDHGVPVDLEVVREPGRRSRGGGARSDRLRAITRRGTAYSGWTGRWERVTDVELSDR